MPEEFVPLDIFLRPPTSEPAMADAPESPIVEPSVARDEEEAIRDARRFRAALADAIDLAVQRVLPEIARGVLGRELQLDRAEIGAIVAGALERFADEKVLSLRAHPDDIRALADLEIPSVADVALKRGDLLIELHDGTIDQRMEARLEAILTTCVR